MTNNGPIVGLEYPATMLRQIISLKRDFDKHGDNTSSTQINHWDDIQITFDTFNFFHRILIDTLILLGRLIFNL